MDKTCTRCGETKPPQEYYRDSKRRDGLHPYCVACSRKAVNASYLKLKLRALAHLGGRCTTCGYDADHRALVIDHVNGDGARERRQGKGLGSTLLKAAIADEAGRYQLLCVNCNSIKRIADGEHGSRVHARRSPSTRRVDKRCPRCGETKPVAEFSSNAARHDGLSVYCAPCKVTVDAEGTWKLRLRVIEHLGGSCKHCGYCEDIHALTIDHVHGDGQIERKSGRGTRALLNAVLVDAANRYQLLCGNCNSIKLFEEQERGARVYARTVPTERIDRPNQRWTPEARAVQVERSKQLWLDPEHRARESARRSEAMRARWASGEVPTRRKTS